ncbi:acyltransferase [Puniceibacterium confluentis]|uniref:acyltransferase n=1 Tax=Puniceibacterium confluentis TaxID=1958944 RepID=UPI001645F246|nr:acyltransferase [Puniceibacterium confluentis]
MLNIVYGLYTLIIEAIGWLPSQHLRRWLYRRLGRMRLESNVAIYRGVRMRGTKKIEIGEGTSIGDRCELDGRAGLRFGRCVNVSTEAMFWTAQHDYRVPEFTTVFAPVEICDWVWIGPRVIVLPGVTVAEGCVVAAGSVVTKSTEPYGVYAGIPARRIAERPQHEFTYMPGRHHVPCI